MSLTIQRETAPTPKHEAWSTDFPGNHLSKDETLSSTDRLETILLEVCEARITLGKKAVKAELVKKGIKNADVAPESFRRRHDESVGGWILEGILTHVNEWQWAWMINQTLAEHQERIEKVQNNGRWFIESIQPVILKHEQHVLRPGKKRPDGFEEHDPTAPPPGYVTQRKDKLVLRTVFVDVSGNPDIVRVDGAIVQQARMAHATPTVNVTIDKDALRDAMKEAGGPAAK